MSARAAVVWPALGAAAVGLVLLGRIPFLVLAMVVSLAAAGETFRLARARGTSPAALVGHGAILAMLAVAHVSGERAPSRFPVVVAVAMPAIVAVMLMRRERPRLTESIGYTIMPVVAIGLLGGYAVALRAAHDGFRAVLALVLMTIANDAASSIVRARRSSASHTLEVVPFAAGAVATLAVAIAVALALDPPLSASSAVILAGLVSAAAPLGDRTRAMLEQDLSADGRPVRAVMLDRIDALVFAAPVFFYAFRVLER